MFLFTLAALTVEIVGGDVYIDERSFRLQSFRSLIIAICFCVDGNLNVK